MLQGYHDNLAILQIQWIPSKGLSVICTNEESGMMKLNEEPGISSQHHVGSPRKQRIDEQTGLSI